MKLPVVILAGGKATRLYPATRTIPKSLMDVAGRPFIFHQLELLRRNNVERVVICAGFLGGEIQSAIGDASRFGLQIEYAFDGPTLLGTAGALKNALDAIGGAFLVLYGDSYLETNYGEIENAFFQSGRLGLMTVYENCGKWDKSNVHFADGVIAQYSKTNRTPLMRHIDYGLGVFRSEAFEDIAPGQFADLESVYQTLIAHGQLSGFAVRERFYEIGSPEGLMETKAYLAKHTGNGAKAAAANSAAANTAAESYTSKYLEDARTILGKIDIRDVDRITDLLVELRSHQGRLFFIGVGGGAGNASHAVNDFRKIAGIEAYTPTDNVSELTARVNDDGWETSFVNWLRISRLSSTDMVFVFSVGGGDLERNISPNIVRALEYAKQVHATVCGVVGRDGGYTARIADACVIVPTADSSTVTPHTEAFQAVLWHLIVSHPALQANAMKWESVR